MPKASDVFKLQNEVMQEYRSFVSSFIRLRDERIKAAVGDAVEGGRLWPEPLIQFNPAFEIECSGRDLADRGLLHEELVPVFGGFRLYKHQVEAIELGNAGKDFVVTSGTGSGKSLTYTIPILHSLFTKGWQGKGGFGLIVYPMNALINSQLAALSSAAEVYEKARGRLFPIKMKRYTGQESLEERTGLKTEVPQVILTNYMMLELIMTRHGDEKVRNAIRDNLRFLVFDELHTYRGRQGADVGLLIRRVRALAKNPVVCIGTSATMATGKTIAEEKAAIAAFATQIFGSRIPEDRIVRETLVRSFALEETAVTPESVRAVMENGTGQYTEERLVRDPLANWLETRIALRLREGVLVRGIPASLTVIARQLAEFIGLPEASCRVGLERLLLRINEINVKIEAENAETPVRRPFYLPYKLHQFISQTEAVYLGLGSPEKRRISLEKGVQAFDDKQRKLPYFQAAFSRYSGLEFLCVRLDEDARRLVPRDFDQYEPSEDEEERWNPLVGYLIPDEAVWDPEQDLLKLPEAWFKRDKEGELQLKEGLPVPTKDWERRLPRRISYDELGNFSEAGKHPYTGWFLPVPLPFDPESGVIFMPGTKESTKLSRLGSEGRSTSTTVLSLAVLRALGREGFDFREQKIMSFTDNRQDAALQSGHFNDFLRVCELRSAVYHALDKNEVLRHATIGTAVFEHLGLPQESYARYPGTYPGKIKENEELLKTYLYYRLVQDLRRAWRLAVPNLEACGLLRIGYEHLDEVCLDEPGWKGIPFFESCGKERRREILCRILDYFRKSYAIHDEKYLSGKAIDENRKRLDDGLVPPWAFADNEKIEEPCYLRLGPAPKGGRIFTESIGPLSALGRYLKDEAGKDGITLKGDEYRAVLANVLHKLAGAGLVYETEIPSVTGEKATYYRLPISSVRWERGKGEALEEDPVRVRSFRERVKAEPNPYFRGLYVSDFRRFKRLEGAEHTGQLSDKDRIEREDKFKAGAISALFCSPTMELGIDIAELNVVHLRNVPPNPANYAQRSGRAGRSGQAALVFTNCSAFSPHDRHYFRRSSEMVSGSVAAPKIDLTNEDLLVSHLQAVYLAGRSVPGLNSSLKDLFEAEDAKLPVKGETKEALALKPGEKENLRQFFGKMVADYRQELERSSWYEEKWLERTIEGMPGRFNEALDRWRRMYAAVQQSIDEASRIIQKGLYPKHDLRMKEAARVQARGMWERDLLCNDVKGVEFSEFYPFRYLAAEGFLPGYNFTRLPIRAFIPVGESGEYLSRPRFIALREFGPENVIYHKGAKYRIDQMMITEVEKNLTSVRIAPDSGFVIPEEERALSVSPFNGAPLEGKNAAEHFQTLLPLAEMKSVQTERISCEEEIRMTMGYKIRTFFGFPGSLDRIRDAVLIHEGEEFMRLKYLPACRLYQFNLGWAASKEKGFLIGLKTGRWKRAEKKSKEEPNAPQKEERLQVSLFTHDTADALYLIPVKALGLSPEGVVTLMFALKRAIEEFFQVESDEIGAELMGSAPNILLYEAAEGSLGVLSRFVEDRTIFPRVVDLAYKLLRYDDETYKAPASYDDLLSYYNQRHHDDIDRRLIKNALERFKLCGVEIDPRPKAPGGGPEGGGPRDVSEDYRKRYAELRAKTDESSPCERKLLDYLASLGLRLPDEAQPSVPGVYCRPDFFYAPETYLFCDGTVHDDPEVASKDERQREDLLSAGYRYLVFHYDDDLDFFVKKHPDIFGKAEP